MTYYIIGLDHIQLAAPEGCEAEARHFFNNLLGWTEIPKPEALRKRVVYGLSVADTKCILAYKKISFPLQKLIRHFMYNIWISCVII